MGIAVLLNTNVMPGTLCDGPAEPAAASNGKVVFYTANFPVSLSVDGGATFSKAVLPDTLLPLVGMQGNSGDQDVVHDPVTDLFIWCSLYTPDAEGRNFIRLAWITAAKLAASGGLGGWTFTDIHPRDFGLSERFLDGPRLVTTRNRMYLTFQAGPNMKATVTSTVIARSTLREMLALATAGTGGVVGWDLIVEPMPGGRFFAAKGCTDRIYWARHPNDSTLRVYWCDDSSSTYFWKDMGVPKFDLTHYESFTPDKVNWLARLSSAITGAARSAEGGFERLVFAWTAGRDASHQHPYVILAHLRIFHVFGIVVWLPVVTATVWNSEHAWAYPAIDLNARGELGVSLAWGGGNIHFAKSAAGVLDPNLTMPLQNVTTTQSDIGQPWGDYLTMQTDRRDPSRFCATGYSHRKQATGGPTADMRYVLFHS